MQKTCMLCDKPLSPLSKGHYCASCQGTRADVIAAIEQDGAIRKAFEDFARQTIGQLRSDGQFIAPNFEIDDRTPGAADIQRDNPRDRFIDTVNVLFDRAAAMGADSPNGKQLAALVTWLMFKFIRDSDLGHKVSENKQARCLNDTCLRPLGIWPVRDGRAYRDLVWLTARRMGVSIKG